MDLTSCKISTLVNIQDWQRRNHAGRVADQADLRRRLSELEANHAKLLDVLSKLPETIRFARNSLMHM